MRVFLPIAINELLMTVITLKDLPGPAALMKTVSGHRDNPDGSAEVIIAAGYSQQDFSKELQNVIQSHAAALSLPLGEFSIWLAGKLETASVVAEDTFTATATDIKETAQSAVPMISIGAVLAVIAIVAIKLM